MIIRVTLDGTPHDIDVCLIGIDKINYFQKSSVVLNAEGYPFVRNYGSTYDKWSCDLTFEDTEVILKDLHEKLSYNLSQVELTLNDAELICGPGIDYTSTFLANVTGLGSVITNYTESRLSLSLDIISSGGSQVQYVADVIPFPSSLAYQYNLKRDMNNQSNSFRSDAYGNSALLSKIRATNTPNNTHSVETVVISNEYDASGLGKFYSTQRSTPFLWPDAGAPWFFPDQSTVNVIISNFNQKRLKFNSWSTTFELLAYNEVF